MRFNLAIMAKRAGVRRKVVPLRPIKPSKAQAQSLALIYRRILAPWNDERILAYYERERVLTTDSVDDLGRLFEELGEQVGRLILELTPDLREWAFRVEGWHRRRWRDTVLAGADVDVSYLIGPSDARETIDAFVGRNVELVRDISQQARGRIADAVYRGVQARTPAREVGKQIAEATGMARKRADRVSADQSVKLSAGLDAQRQREAGLTTWRWNHSGKLHPRQFHKERDGNLYADDSADRGTLSSGAVVREPPKDRPGELPFCGCVRQGVLVIDGDVL